MPKIAFIGAGTVGTALAVRLSGAGYTIASVYSRSQNSAAHLARLVTGCRALNSSQAAADSADIIFITTPAAAIPSVAAAVAWRSGQSVIHCSGADSTEILEPAARAGAFTGVFHPLQTFAGVAQALANLPGSTFGIEAQEPLLSTLKEMADKLGGYWVEIKPVDRVAYHAAAVMTSNYTVTLFKMAADLWQTFGVAPPQAARALLPLLRGTVNNIEKFGIPGCLTGPVARGDAVTVRKHIAMLDERAPGLLPAYRELGRQTVPVAVAKGKIDTCQAQELQAALA